MEYHILLWILLTIIIVIFLLPKRSNNTTTDEDKIKSLVRQASRWAVASAQDENPMIAVLHGNYGAGYLWSLLDIYKPEQIEDAMGDGFDFNEFRKRIVDVQDNATKSMARACPKYTEGLEPYLSKLSGENV